MGTQPPENHVDPHFYNRASPRMWWCHQCATDEFMTLQTQTIFEADDAVLGPRHRLVAERIHCTGCSAKSIWQIQGRYAPKAT